VAISGVVPCSAVAAKRHKKLKKEETERFGAILPFSVYSVLIVAFGVIRLRLRLARGTPARRLFPSFLEDWHVNI
jgi:hypothetical protein